MAAQIGEKISDGGTLHFAGRDDVDADILAGSQQTQQLHSGIARCPDNADLDHLFLPFKHKMLT